MIQLKTEAELNVMRKSNALVTNTLAELVKYVKPGVSTLELDKRAEEFIRDNKGIPGFKGYNKYPNTLCTSVNNQVVHGIPSNYLLKDGDILAIDCGVIFEEYYGDAAYTFEIGNVSDKNKRLLKITKESLFLGIENAIEGKRIGDIGFAIQTYCEQNGYSVVREMVGHGLGKRLHEPPEVPNYGKRGNGPLMKKGMVICIEPMINMGKKNIVQENDGWTIRTADNQPSAHFELAIAIDSRKAELLTTFAEIEKELEKIK